MEGSSTDRCSPHPSPFPPALRSPRKARLRNRLRSASQHGPGCRQRKTSGRRHQLRQCGATGDFSTEALRAQSPVAGISLRRPPLMTRLSMYPVRCPLCRAPDYAAWPFRTVDFCGSAMRQFGIIRACATEAVVSDFGWKAVDPRKIAIERVCLIDV